MSRINNMDLERLLGFDEDTLTDVDDFIEAASCIVDDMVESCSKTFNDNRLTKIELWLTAHLYAIRNPILMKEKFENAENTYQVATSGEGILSTTYGQTANTLSGGCLKDVDMRETQIYFT